MKRRAAYAAGIIGLIVSLSGSCPISAGPGSIRGQKGSPAGAQVTATPGRVHSPLNATNKMAVCVSGLSEGNCVTVSIPWMGTVNYHSLLNLSQCVDLSGGFCMSYPPDWTTSILEPGVYTIETSVDRDVLGGDRAKGPATTFEVVTD